MMNFIARFKKQLLVCILLLILITFIIFINSAYLLSVFSLLTIYCLIYFLLFYKINLPMKKRYIFFILAIFVTTIVVFYYWYLNVTNNIMTWDSSAYWINNLRFSNDNLDSVVESLKRVVNTINADEYNSFPSFLLQPIFHISNLEFSWYIYSILIQFFVASFLSFLLLSNRIFNSLFKDLNNKKNTYIIFTLISLLTYIMNPQLHQPILKGMLDIINLIYIFIIYSIVADYDFIKFKIKDISIISICLFLIIITRRYYSFWILGFYFALGIYYFINYIFFEKELSFFLKRALNIFLSGFIALSGILILFFPMVVKIISSNYSYFYKAYLNGNIIDQILSLIKQFGFGIISFSVIGLFLSIKFNNMRKLSIILFINLIITLFLFNRVQTMGMQHIYIILPILLYGLIMFVANVIKMDIKHNLKTTILIIYVVFIISNFIISFNKINQNGYMFKSNLFGEPVLIPTVRDDYNKIDELNDYILSIVDENNKIYIIGASHMYNSETFANFKLPSLIEKDKYYYEVSNVDLTHGFNTNIFDSKYVMTISPTQYHMNPNNERVVTMLYNSIENDTIISDNYKLIYSYDKIDNMKFNIYVKISEYTFEEKAYFANEMDKYYYNLPDLFRNRIMK